MTRKFKMAGVLMAVVAMFALTASSASATFTSSVTPNLGTGTSSGDKFEAFGSTVECSENTYHVGKYETTVPGQPGVHVAAEFPTNTLTVKPTYKNCKGFGLPATVNFTGCDYDFHTGPTVLGVLLTCPIGVTGVDITIFSSAAHSSALCHVVVHPFGEKTGLTASNSGEHVLLKGTVENITATQERTNFLCPAGTHTSTAKYKVQESGITIEGKEGSVSVS